MLFFHVLFLTNYINLIINIIIVIIITNGTSFIENSLPRVTACMFSQII